jgi:DNA helicase-2/ATP-dependent DNA helicase PcrA
MLHGQTRYCIPSAFLDEIPDGLLLKLNRNAAPAAAPVFGLAGSGHGSRPPSAEPAVGGLRIGQTVEHPRFGVGVIVATEGRGADARVQVNFGGGAGMKWLALEYAKLTPV